MNGQETVKIAIYACKNGITIDFINKNEFLLYKEMPKSPGYKFQNFREDETGLRHRERYDDERVDPEGWMVRSWRI